MRSIIYFTFLALVTLTLFSACKDESTFEEPTLDIGQDYFPLEIGKQITYRVDSLIYDPVSETEIVVDTSLTYIKEEIVDTFRDEVGRLMYRIERFKSYDTNFDWEIADVWSATADHTRAERFEENLRFVKMVFPITRNDIWDGNVYIDETNLFPIAGESIEIFKSWFYEVLSVDEPNQVGDFSFDEVTVIQQANEENLIERRYSLEKYAKDIGLVYREMEIYDTQEIDESIPWVEKADKGFSLKMTVIDYN